MKITIDTNKIIKDIVNTVIGCNGGDPAKVIRSLVPILAEYENKLATVNERMDKDLFHVDEQDLELCGAYTHIVARLQKELLYYNMRLCGYKLNEGRWERGNG